jgi:signal transduction histidine kinase/ActR/RegA family two-component response regulator
MREVTVMPTAIRDMTTRTAESPATLDGEIVQPLHRLLQASVEFIGADKGSLQLYDEHRGSFEMITQVGFDQQFHDRFRFLRASSSVAVSDLQSGQHAIIQDDCSGDPIFKELVPVYDAHAIVAMQSTPLLSSHGKLIGILSTHFCRPHHASERDLRFLEFCGEQAARLIEQGQAGRQLRAATQRLKQQNDELQQLNLTLGRSNQDLERFAFAASHDLQEPLRMITTYTQLLAQRYGGDNEKDSAMFVGNIVQGTTRMRDLLADLLAYAEVGAFREESIEVVDLNVVVEKVRQNLKASIDASGASIISAELPTLSAHECHFVQLFQNLISNAMKYRSEQRPLIHISAQEADGKVEFAVTDNGLGIDPRYHESIFHAFQRLHDNQCPGTGIGLAICQRVVERYGGRIWVESQIGEGSTFRFRLPNSRVRSVGEHCLLAGAPARKVRVLLVDDNPADVSLFRMALEDAEFNCELTVIDDGAEALAFVGQQRQKAGNHTPELAVLDLNLPKSNGLEILEAMSKTPAFANVPVAVMSSVLSPSDLAKIQRFKVAHYITKPSTLEEVLRIGFALKQLVQNDAGGRSTEALA